MKQLKNNKKIKNSQIIKKLRKIKKNNIFDIGENIIFLKIPLILQDQQFQSS